jgi:hypothetical protein
MYLDDDDMLREKDAIEQIVKSIKSEDDLILWRVRFPTGMLIPDDEQWYKIENGALPVVKCISGIGFCFHSKFKNQIEWGFWKRGDYRVIKKLYSLCNSKIFINLALTRIQEIPHSGKITDKIIKKYELNPNETMVKVILIKSLYKSHYLGKVGTIMEVPESMARGLINNGVAKEMPTALEKKLEAKDEENIKEKNELVEEEIKDDIEKTFNNEKQEISKEGKKNEVGDDKEKGENSETSKTETPIFKKEEEQKVFEKRKLKMEESGFAFEVKTKMFYKGNKEMSAKELISLSNVKYGQLLKS